jgi:hypothetical protein
MTKSLLTAVLAGMALGVQVVAQAPQAPKPGPEHKAMAFFAGRWTSEGEMKPGPLGPGGRATGSDTCELFDGGFHVVCRGEGKGPMGTMTSLAVMAYRPAEKEYTFYGIDNFGSSELSRGTKKGTTWTYTATSHYGGQTFQSRYTIVETGPDSYTFKWEASPDGSKWSPLFEGKATRASKTSSR